MDRQEFSLHRVKEVLRKWSVGSKLRTCVVCTHKLKLSGSQQVQPRGRTPRGEAPLDEGAGTLLVTDVNPSGSWGEWALTRDKG